MKILIVIFLIISCKENQGSKKNSIENLSSDYSSKNISKKELRKKMIQTSILSYKQARKYLLGHIHLNKKNNSIEDVYCLKKFTNKDIPTKFKIGKNRIPDYKIINTEHVWPKSRFFSKRVEDKRREQRVREADLHILYPSSTELNEARNRYKFGEVIDQDRSTQDFDCSNAQLGKAKIKGRKSRDLFFEPPQKSKGNVARAIFYFSVRYDEPVSFYEEKFLKEWNRLDPPDEFEKRRNDMIEKYQGNRNPFIDNYALVDKISDF